jgi:hypothetical protein
MSSFEDAIWNHLVARHQADRLECHLPRPRRPAVRGRAASASAVALAAIVTAVVLVLGASSSAPPAYAVTPRGAGSYTVSLNDLTRGIPALNARFVQLGLRITVVRVTPNCRSRFFELQAGPGSLSETVTVSNRGIPAGWRGFLAAAPLPGGHVGLLMGDTPEPIPSCITTKTSHGIPVPNHP